MKTVILNEYVKVKSYSHCSEVTRQIFDNYSTFSTGIENIIIGLENHISMRRNLASFSVHFEKSLHNDYFKFIIYVEHGDEGLGAEEEVLNKIVENLKNKINLLR